MVGDKAMSGKLSLVGVGPGDPELLTLKAVRVLQAANVVAYPSTGDGESAFAFDIARAHVPATATLQPVPIPMTPERGPAQAAYTIAAEVLRGQVEYGYNVVWLCEGDPLLYGSAMYLLARLGNVIPVEIVPGITSLTAAAAAIARPLAARNEMFKVLPAPLPDDILKIELDTTEAAAIIKVGRHFDRIRALLESTGHAANAVIVEYATTSQQRVTPLREFAADARPYFSTILCYRGTEAWG
jgi:precorrin-2/cobalt-factor-2 C20-methyltransferase